MLAVYGLDLAGVRPLPAAERRDRRPADAEMKQPAVETAQRPTWTRV